MKMKNDYNLKNKENILQYIIKQYELQITTFKQIDSRISNRLALLGAFVLILLATIPFRNSIYKTLENKIILFIIIILFFLLVFFLFLSFYYILKLLTVKIYAPFTPVETFLKEKCIDRKILLNSFISNYSNAYLENEKILNQREKIGSRFIFLNKISLLLLILYILSLSTGIIFFNKSNSIINVNLTNNKLEVQMSIDDENKNETKTKEADTSDDKIEVSPDLTGKPKLMQFSEDRKKKNLKESIEKIDKNKD